MQQKKPLDFKAVQCLAIVINGPTAVAAESSAHPAALGFNGIIACA
jgi:hypothetical protein